nr:MAG TPA: hypothetical protein [Caudoviricetes sp.]
MGNVLKIPCFVGKNCPYAVDYMIVSVPQTFIEICPHIKHSKTEPLRTKNVKIFILFLLTYRYVYGIL